MGDGIAGQGFEAIVGIKPNNDAKIPNPLRALGAARWSLVLPGGRLGGMLVLNPDPQALAGFVSLPVATGPDTRLHDAVRGCIQNDATRQRLCGFIQMDTGAPGIHVTSPQSLPGKWRPKVPATLLFMDAAGQTRATESFHVNDRTQMSRVRFEQKTDAQYTVIHAGGSPLLCFEVLFDGDAGTLGFKARATGPLLQHCSVP